MTSSHVAAVSALRLSKQSLGERSLCESERDGKRKEKQKQQQEKQENNISLEGMTYAAESREWETKAIIITSSVHQPEQAHALRASV